MKKVIIALAVSAFALTASLFAADTKTAATTKDTGACCDKAKAGSACCDKTKTSASADTKGACCDKDKVASKEIAGDACCGMAKSACSKTPSKGIAMSPRAAALAAK